MCIDSLARAPHPAKQDAMRQRAGLEQKLAFAREALFQAAAFSRDASVRLRRALRIAGVDVQSE
jgi:hypothetical protein